MKTVLLIEDNREILENTVELLELEGYLTMAASTGSEGVRLAKENRPDVILCDIMMPEMDGWEVIRMLKANDATRYIPFIFTTASVEKKEIKSGFELGADGYVRKPFETEELFAAITSCIGKSQVT